MSQPLPFLTDAVGFWRDSPREQLPQGYVWNMVDWIPNLGAPVSKRGGWTQFSDDVSTHSSSATYVPISFNADFPAGTKLGYITDNAKLGTLSTSTGVSTNIGNVVVPLQNPVLHRGTLVIPASDGTTAPSYYDGVTTVGSLGGSPPACKFACVYIDRTVLANSNAQPSRIQFSDAGNPASWTSTSWINSTYPVTAVASLAAAVLIFSAGHTERIRGTTPPPGTDMKLESLFDQGCIDARSVAQTNQSVIFANNQGIFLTDGAAIVDLTVKGGISKYWRDTMASWTTSWTLAGGIFSGRYVISLMNGSTFVDCLMCDLASRTWTRHANVKTMSFAHVLGTAEKLYYGSRAGNRVNEFSTVFQPSSTVKNDGDGTAVTPVLESAFLHGYIRWNRRYLPSPGVQTWRTFWSDYDLRDSASDTPTLQFAYVKDPSSSSYTNFGTALAATTAKTRVKRDIAVSSIGLGIKITQANASATTNLYTVERYELPREVGRVS